VEAVERKESGNGPVRLRRTGKVAATVKIEKHDVRATGLQAVRRGHHETSRRDFDCWRNFVGIGCRILRATRKSRTPFKRRLTRHLTIQTESRA